MRRAADLERLAVEVFAAQGQDLAEAQAAVGEDADHRLVAPGSFGEAVHLLEGEHSDRAGLLLRSRIVGANADALEGIEVADFVGDRVLCHRGECTQDADRPGGRSAFDPKHVVDQVRAWRRRSSRSGQSFKAMPSITTSATRLMRCSLVALVRSDLGCRSVQAEK